MPKLRDINDCLDAVQRAVEAKPLADISFEDKHGLILYHYLRYKLYHDNADACQVNILLSALIDELLACRAELKSLSGFVIINELINEKILHSDVCNKIHQLDTFLANNIPLLYDSNSLNPLQGLIGIIHYFIERLPNPEVEKHLWMHIPLVLETVLNRYPHEKSRLTEVGLGMVNGITGILFVLMKIYEKGLFVHDIKEIVYYKISDIVSSRQEIDFLDNKFSLFPEVIRGSAEGCVFGNAMTWSEGDLNKSLLLYKACHVFHDTKFEQIANLVGLNTLLRKTKKTTNVRKAGFYEGAAGVAQTYRILHTLSQQPAYWEGYIYWIKRTTKLLKREIESDYYRTQELDLLHGMIGSALVLLNYLLQTQTRSSWSKSFLL